MREFAGGVVDVAETSVPTLVSQTKLVALSGSVYGAGTFTWAGETAPDATSSSTRSIIAIPGATTTFNPVPADSAKDVPTAPAMQFAPPPFCVTSFSAASSWFRAMETPVTMPEEKSPDDPAPMAGVGGAIMAGAALALTL